MSLPRTALALSCMLLACQTKSARKPAEPREADAHVEQALKQKGAPPRASIEQGNLAVPANLPWLVFGGGSEPLSNQVSLAQDIELVSTLLAGRGITLFASGPGAQLAVERPHKADDSVDVRDELARVLGTPEAYRMEYRPATMPIDGPSSSEQVRDALTRALAQGDKPLFVYGACHGSPGERARQNSLGLWGGWPLTVEDVASVLDAAPGTRGTRFVLTACFGGGFAELLFEGADDERALRKDDFCGLFAAPADDEASGCDPNPERREQESYSIHLLHALTGKDRDSKERVAHIDLNGDGAVGLLEAHTYARIASRSFDIPTTTSERFLRYAVKSSAKAALNPDAAPEDMVVIHTLGATLELNDEASARTKLNELTDIMNEAGKLLDEAQKGADDAFYALRISLLERYPLLEHPWEARAQKLVQREAQTILGMLQDSELAQAHQQAEQELGETLMQHDAVRIARARVLRLVQAYETVRLASALLKRGGPNKAHYERLRACERWVPPLRGK